MKSLALFFINLFFPKSCFGCHLPTGKAGKSGTYICDSCFKKIEIVLKNQCPICGRITPNGAICQKCQENSFLNRLIWAVPYSNPLIKKLIKAFKYNYIKELAKPLSELLIKSLTQCWTSHVPHNAVVVPIPLFKRKLRERDFNQAELLAEEIARQFSILLETGILKRIQFTFPQAKIKDYKIRRENVKNIFEIEPKFVKRCKAENKNLLQDKTIILVDDVATTGATLSEAAKILKQAGAKEIWGLVVAKG